MAQVSAKEVVSNPLTGSTINRSPFSTSLYSSQNVSQSRCQVFSDRDTGSRRGRPDVKGIIPNGSLHLGEQTVADLASFIMALASGLIFVFVLGENEGRRCFEEWTGMLCALAGIVRVENAAEGHESVEDALVAVFWHGSGPVAGDFLRTSILLEPRSASGFGVGRGMVLPELERVPGVFPDLRAALHLPEM